MTQILKKIIVFIAIFCVIFCFSGPVGAFIEEPKSILPSDALKERIKTRYTERHHPHEHCKQIGYKYNSGSGTWIIRAGYLTKYTIYPEKLNEDDLAKLIEYMVYVDKCSDAAIDEAGALAVTATGVVCIVGGGPILASGCLVVIAGAVIRELQVLNDMDKCTEYAKVVAEKLGEAMRKQDL